MKHLHSLIFFSVVAVVIAANVLVFTPIYQSYRDNVTKIEALTVEHITAHIEQNIIYAAESVRRFAPFIREDLSDPANPLFLEHFLNDELFLEISLVDLAGNEVYKKSATAAGGEKELGNVRESGIFRKTLESGDIAYGDIAVPDSLEPQFPIGVPVFDSGKNMRGMIVATLSISFLFRDIKNPDFENGGMAYVVDESGLVIAHPDSGVVARGANLSDHDIVRAVLAQKRTVAKSDDTYTHKNIYGEEVLAVGTYIEPVRWAVIFSESKRDVMKNALVVGGFNAVSVAIVISLLFVFMRNNERLLVAQRNAHKALMESEKFSKIAENNPEGVSIVDISGGAPVYTYVNTAWEKMTRWKKDEVVGKKQPNILKSGKQDAAFYRKLWKTILAGNIFTAEMINKRKDGTLYDADIVIIPIKDAGGGIVSFAEISRDITERKKSGARPHLAIGGNPAPQQAHDRTRAQNDRAEKRNEGAGRKMPCARRGLGEKHLSGAGGFMKNRSALLQYSL